MKQYRDKEWLEKMYKVFGIGKIAKMCNVSLMCIHKWLVKFEIPRRKFCGRGGKYCSRWKGGRTKSKTGYIWIHYPKPHLHRISSNHLYVPEQILVAEKTLGRLLSKDEVIHHINENKSDNRPENLYLFENTNEHSRYHQKFRKGTAEMITESNLCC